MMLSRVVDSLYWMSRYLERTEHTARMLDVHLNLMLDIEPGILRQQRMNRLLEGMLITDDVPEDITEVDLLEWLTFDAQNPLSIISKITGARENARQVREQISSEMWTQINKLYLYIKNCDINEWRESPHDLYLEIKEGAHLFQGITDATMNHNQGWHFIQMGRYIERALSLLRLLTVHFNQTSLGDDAQRNIPTNIYFELVATLKSVSAFEAYCKVYNPNLQPVRIVEFLLFNEHFPRSLRFCVDQTLISLHSVADTTMRSKNSRLYRNAGRLQSKLSYDEIMDVDELHDYMETIKDQIFHVHGTLYDTFITYSIESAL